MEILRPSANPLGRRPSHHSDEERLISQQSISLDRISIQSDDHERIVHEPEISSLALLPSSPVASYGKPASKTLFNPLDVFALLLSYACLVIGVTVVGNHHVAWLLAYNNQLTVLGLLLSFMNWCTMRILPTVLLMLEALYGPSLLQNYDSILRMTFSVSRASMRWRLAIVFLLVLPAGLSVAYKQFEGGVSSVHLSSAGGYYGMIGPPGINTLGSIGLQLMTNATLPFVVASTPDQTLGPDPAFPSLPQVYGYNTLLLSNTSAALLDAPQPLRVAEIQGSLGKGEVWELTTEVHGTVTYNIPSFNRSALNATTAQDPFVPLPAPSDFFCLPLYNGYAFGLWVNQLGGRNESYSYAGVFGTHDFSTGQTPINSSEFANFTNVALQFFTERRQCRGTWRISFDAITLQGGTCSETALPIESQAVFANATLALSEWYLPLLAETLAPYGNERNQSAWLAPAYAVNIASMYWSRVAVLVNKKFGFLEGADTHDNQPELVYRQQDSIVSTRTTMRRSWVVYLILIIQPFICTVSILYAPYIGTAPIGKGFNLIAVLAGLDHSTAKTVHGASFSGELRKPLRLRITSKDPSVMELQPGSCQSSALPKSLHVEKKKPLWRRLLLGRLSSPNASQSVSRASILYSLGDPGPNQRLRKNTKYA